MQIIIFSALAGIVGTGLGGLVSVLLMKRSTDKMACLMLSFAAGIMTSVVCFGLVRESIELTGVPVSVCGLILGVVVIMVLDRIVDRITPTDESNRKVHQTPEDLYHEGLLIKDSSRMLRSGFIMLVAIGLHNFPEGLAIGAGGSHDFALGIMLAAIIALHNIPEGMAIATPMLAGGVRKRRVLFLTALSGAPTLLGGVLGVLIGGISNFAVSFVLSIAGGAMLYIVFGEIIPQTVIMVKNRSATIAALLGIIIGLVISYV